MAQGKSNAIIRHYDDEKVALKRHYDDELLHLCTN